jgi:hypothetical protein
VRALPEAEEVLRRAGFAAEEAIALQGGMLRTACYRRRD